MTRPLLLRALPDRLRDSLFARYYRGRHAAFPALYEAAPLGLAPDVQMTLLPGDVISDYIAFTGVYELALSKRVAALADRGGTMIDVGANLGYFSLLWASRHRQNRVIALEASPRNVDLLTRNVRRNGFESRIRVVPCAAAAAPGRLSFDIGPEDQTGWGGLTQGSGARVIEVEALRVDDCVPPGTTVALLKVDTEGADAWALMGCERLLQERAIDEIWFEEFKPRAEALGIPPGAGATFLRSFGYTVTSQGDASAEMVEWCARRP